MSVSYVASQPGGLFLGFEKNESPRPEAPNSLLFFFRSILFISSPELPAGRWTNKSFQNSSIDNTSLTNTSVRSVFIFVLFPSSQAMWTYPLTQDPLLHPHVLFCVWILRFSKMIFRRGVSSVPRNTKRVVRHPDGIRCSAVPDISLFRASCTAIFENGTGCEFQGPRCIAIQVPAPRTSMLAVDRAFPGTSTLRVCGIAGRPDCDVACGFGSVGGGL